MKIIPGTLLALVILLASPSCTVLVQCNIFYINPTNYTLTAGSGPVSFLAGIDGNTAPPIQPSMVTWTITPSLGFGTLSSDTGTTVQYTPPARLEATTVATVSARYPNFRDPVKSLVVINPASGPTQQITIAAQSRPQSLACPGQ